MNNNNNWKNRRSNSSGKKWNKNKGSGKQNSQRSRAGERNFQKFVDTEHMNYESNYWPQNNFNNDNRRANYCNYNESATTGAIHSWIRKKPTNHLIIPPHINFDEQLDQEFRPNSIDPVQNRTLESIVVKKEHPKVNREIEVLKSDNTEIAKHPSDVHQTAISTTALYTVQIKQEKDEKSSSSSSSSESSSSEDESEPNNKTSVSVKPEKTSIAKPPPSPIDIKLKSRTNSVSSLAVNTTEKVKQQTESSSSSSSEEDSPPSSTVKVEKNSPGLNKSGSTSKKTSSEDDVVCVENLDNKIVLEDESDNSSTHKESENETANTFSALPKEKTGRKTPEKCMICDKNGHTSFQCQMICKNCSAPYHGYRTCPHPANLSTMLQLFIEFCMQQLQNFKVEKQITTNNCNSVPKPKVDALNLPSFANKSNKLKRKHNRSSDGNKKHKKSIKRKTSVSKKTKSKANSDESSDDDNEDDSDAETSSTATDDHISDSSAESLVSSKKKRKLKNLNTSKAGIDLSNFSSNSVGLPMVLNGLPHFTVPTTSIQNPNTSANALNTLLLTQMFQSAIDSLKK